MSLLALRRLGSPASLALAAWICVGCAEGSSAPPDARKREGGARDTQSAEINLAPLDTSADRRLADRGMDAILDQPAKDLPRDQRAPDLGCGCGAGMICAGGTCVCDPATCPGCCTSDGKSCKTGQDNAECGTGGVTCKACSTSDSCKTASCATGTCVLSRKNGAAYPCPGAFGTVCGGTTGIACFTGLVCVSFTSGAKGYCSKTCTGSGSTCTGAPSGATAQCVLSGSGLQYCGFVCDPGLCPSGTSCDYFDGLCKA